MNGKARTVTFFYKGQQVHQARISTARGFGRALQKAKRAVGPGAIAQCFEPKDETGKEVWAYDFGE